MADKDHSEMPENLFDFILPSGKRLGDANAAELRKAANVYLGIGAAAERKATACRAALRPDPFCD